MIKFIFAIDKNNLIGNTQKKYGMPWRYIEDLKYYQKKINNQIIVFGRKTYEQMGINFNNNQVYILSKNKKIEKEKVKTISNIQIIIDISKNKDVYICGGVEIFILFQNYVEEIFITRIDKEYSGDIYFNEIDKILRNFDCVQIIQGKNPDLSFQKWVKNENKTNK